MKRKLKPGAHLILVANDKGESSKSAVAIECRAAATMEQIPSRLITFDRSNDTLMQAFRGKGVHTLAKPNGDVLLATFGEHIDLARENGELIIVDMPPTVTDGDTPLIKALTVSEILTECDTISYLIPAKPHNDHIKGALDALAAYSKVPIKFDRGLIRAWRPDALTWPTWEAFPAYSILTTQFPVWEVGTYMQSFADMIQGRGAFVDFPAIDELPEFFANKAGTMSTRERGALRAAVSHLEKARAAIKQHLFDPITEPVEKPAKSVTA